MHRYELLLLTVPEITEDETRSLKSQLDKLVREAKGTTISFERWGKYRLAYPIKKNEYGIYFLMQFEVETPQSLLSTIDSLLTIKLSEIVMRSMFTALSPKQSLAYHRPPSLEETPSRDVDSFLKEHKMEGLLSSISSIQTEPKEKPEVTEKIIFEKTIDDEKKPMVETSEPAEKE